jgi:hypothetical protein
MGGADFIVGEPAASTVKDMYRAAGSGNGAPVEDGTDNLIGGSSKTFEKTDATTEAPVDNPVTQPVDKPAPTPTPTTAPQATATILEFERDLNTCDAHDRVISEGVHQVLYAYGGETFGYHMNNRGSKSQILRGKSDQNLPSNALSYTIRAPNVQVPAEGYDNPTTSYMCFSHDVDTPGDTFNLIGWSPVIEAGHEANFHHVLVYDCDMTDDESALLKNGMHCEHANMPTNVLACQSSPVLAWAVGGGLQLLPEHVSMPTGKRLLFEIHYDNPLKKAFTDNSGITMHYVNQKRANDAAILAFGSPVVATMTIPPHQESYKVVAYCSGLQSRAFIPEDGVNVFGWALHTHTVGVAVKARHFRPTDPDCLPTAQSPCAMREMAPIAKDMNYDFNFQEMSMMPQEIKILPGDEFWIECTYDTRGRDFVTHGGEGTGEEMCLAFLEYYPKIEHFGYCVSMYMDVEAMMKGTGPPVPVTFDQFQEHMGEELPKGQNGDIHMTPMGVTTYNNKAPVYTPFFHPPMASMVDPALLEFYTPEDPCNAARRGLRAQDMKKSIRQLQGSRFDHSSYDHTMPMDVNGKVHFHWHVDEAAGRIKCALEVNDHDGYVAVGFNNNGGMGGADFIVGEPAASTVKDMYRAAGSGNGAPVEDGTDNLIGGSAEKFNVYPSPSPSPSPVPPASPTVIVKIHDHIELAGVKESDLTDKKKDIGDAICVAIEKADATISKCTIQSLQLHTSKSRHLLQSNRKLGVGNVVVKFTVLLVRPKKNFDTNAFIEKVATAMESAMDSGTLQAELRTRTGQAGLTTDKVSYERITSSDAECTTCDDNGTGDGKKGATVLVIVLVLCIVVILLVVLVILIAVCRKTQAQGRKDSVGEAAAVRKDIVTDSGPWHKDTVTDSGL